MVLTRSVRSQLASEGVDINSVLAMENVPRTSTVTLASTSLPVNSVASIPATVTNATANIIPAVQQFMTLAHDRSNVSNESHLSNTTIVSPDYSSITARDVQRAFHAERTTVNPVLSTNGINVDREAVSTLREEFTRQIQELQRTMQQEFARVCSQQLNPVAQPTHAFAAPQQPQPGGQNNLLGTGSQQHTAANMPSRNLFQNYTSQPNYPFMGPQQPAFGQPQAYTGHSSPVPMFNMPPPSSRTGYTLPSSSKVDLSKWGIKFDGTAKSMSAEDFIFRVDILRQDYNCSFNETLRSFHLLLEGQALDWYWNVRKLTPIQTWDDLQRAFLMQYRRYENEFQLQKKIMDRRQMPQESFEDFYNAVLKLRNQQRSPYPEKDLIEIMKSNLKPSLSHLLFSVKMSCLNEFCQQAKRAESLLSSQRQQYGQRQFQAPKVHEIVYEEDLAPGVCLEAISSNRLNCWNCGQMGHSFIDCPSPNRRVFCFKCGRDNVVTPKCPKCQGNRQVNQSQMGETRSTQT